MTLSRRDILIQGCAVGAGIIAINMPGIVAFAQGGPPLRRSLRGMALNDPILEAWRDGVRQLKARPASNPVSWGNFSAIHGNEQFFNLCPHGNWYFLPWHRAYLLMYERAVRQLTGHTEFALPYWDWTQERQMPAAFVEPVFGGQPNPLFEPLRDASPRDALGDEIVGQDVINTIMTQTPFEAFGTSRPAGQNNLDQSWINCQFCGSQGTLESTPHNLVHNFVGGLMATAQSSLDPIFMTHHCNIDRIWWLWTQGGQVDSPDPLWRDMTFQNNFVNPDGTLSSPNVSELQTPEQLGYTYNTGPASSTTPPAFVGVSETFKILYAVSSLSDLNAAGVTTYVKENDQAASVGKYLEVKLDVDANALSTVASRRTAPSGTGMLNLSEARKEAAAGPRALAFIRDIAYSADENTLYRVFINCDYLSENTPATDRHYVGTFGFFGRHDGHAGHQRGPTIALDLTPAIQSVYGSAIAPSGALRVQIQPAPQRAEAKAAGTATPRRVEVALLSG